MFHALRTAKFFIIRGFEFHSTSIKLLLEGKKIFFHEIEFSPSISDFFDFFIEKHLTSVNLVNFMHLHVFHADHFTDFIQRKSESLSPKDHLKPGAVFFQVHPLIAGGPLGIDQALFLVKPDARWTDFQLIRQFGYGVGRLCSIISIGHFPSSILKFHKRKLIKVYFNFIFQQMQEKIKVHFNFSLHLSRFSFKNNLLCN